MPPATRLSYRRLFLVLDVDGDGVVSTQVTRVPAPARSSLTLEAARRATTIPSALE